jgi:hypothetical protein
MKLDPTVGAVGVSDAAARASRWFRSRGGGRGSARGRGSLRADGGDDRPSSGEECAFVEKNYFAARPLRHADALARMVAVDLRDRVGRLESAQVVSLEAGRARRLVGRCVDVVDCQAICVNVPATRGLRLAEFAKTRLCRSRGLRTPLLARLIAAVIAHVSFAAQTYRNRREPSPPERMPDVREAGSQGLSWNADRERWTGWPAPSRTRPALSAR